MSSKTESSICCSTITFRHRPLGEALALIAELGVKYIDIGALPGICEHIPANFDESFVESLEAQLLMHGLSVVSINYDPGAINDPGLSSRELMVKSLPLVKLAARLRASLVIPNGGQSGEPFIDVGADISRSAQFMQLLALEAKALNVTIWVEAPHSMRLVNSLDRTRQLISEVPTVSAQFVLDVSHIVSVGEDPVAWAGESISRIAHVHLRDAVPGNINISIGHGDADFGALIDSMESLGYKGYYSLELETHDVEEADRFERAKDSLERVSHWIEDSRKKPGVKNV